MVVLMAAAELNLGGGKAGGAKVGGATGSGEEGGRLPRLL